MKIICLLILLLFENGLLYGQITKEIEASTNSIILEGPIPFSLDTYSAIQCIELLKRVRFIELHKESEHPAIVKVDKVWSYFLDFDEDFPEGYRKRYDIIVNEKPLDWDNSFIEYGGEMINLRLLFTYRNQHPPEGLKYRSKP